MGRGELVAVVGGVGSGKSSLLAALTGELAPQESSAAVNVAGRVALVPQQVTTEPLPSAELGSRPGYRTPHCGTTSPSALPGTRPGTVLLHAALHCTALQVRGGGDRLLPPPGPLHPAGRGPGPHQPSYWLYTASSYYRLRSGRRGSTCRADSDSGSASPGPSTGENAAQSENAVGGMVCDRNCG